MPVVAGCTLHASWQLPALGSRLAERLVEQWRQRGPFFSPMIVVPNRNVRKWVQMWVARETGVAINLKLPYLEDAIWSLLRACDEGAAEPHARLLDHQHLRMMIVTALLDEGTDDADLAPLLEYLPSDRKDEHGRVRREVYRRAWQLADRLAGLFRDYEYHREEMMSAWREKRPFDVADDGRVKKIEACERALHRAIFGDGGWRSRLNAPGHGPLLTLGEYAADVMKRNGDGGTSKEQAPRPAVHLLGLGQISPFHARVLRWLGERCEMDVYMICPQTAAMEGNGGDDDLLRRMERPGDTADSLLAAWNGPGAISARLLMHAAGDDGAAFNVVPAQPPPENGNVLQRVQRHLMGLDDSRSRKRIPQDTSLQISGCASIHRETQCVYQSILHNLKLDAKLQCTDIAVLVPRMQDYATAFHAVFGGSGGTLPYNIADTTADDNSALGQGLLQLLDLASSPFTRSAVCKLLLNPCVLAAMGIERADASAFIRWAHALNVCHCFDERDRRERGYALSSLYTWRLAMQRLRLGRLFEPETAGEDGLASQWQRIVPYADIDSADPALLGRFCWVVEQLHLRLKDLRSFSGSASDWRRKINLLAGDFLAVPDDRPEEEQVRQCILSAMDQFAHMGGLGTPAGGKEGAKERGIQLHLVRDYLRENLRGIDASFGSPLTGGVTISCLQPMRPLPFKIIYIMGLGEGDFPGTTVASTLDLRDARPAPADIATPDANRHLFMEAALAARQKLYLSYVNRDLQKDQDLYPCSLINQLLRFINRNITSGPFQVMRLPLPAGGAAYLDDPSSRPWTDMLVTYDRCDRILSLLDGSDELGLAEKQRRAIDAAQAAARIDFSAKAGTDEATQPREPIFIRELRAFIENPIEASAKRHLRLYEEQIAPIQDDEPFFSVFPLDWLLATQTLRRFVLRAREEDVWAAIDRFADDFDKFYQSYHLQSQTPDKPFDAVDARKFKRSLLDRIGQPDGAGLAAFIEQRRKMEFFRGVVIGQAGARAAADARFPSPIFKAHDREAHLSGTLPLVWRSDERVETLVITNKSSAGVPAFARQMLDAFLFLAAARAGKEAGETGECSSDWVGNREWVIHVAFKDKIRPWTYRGMSAGQCREYLHDLTSDFLDRATFDLLPFELITVKKELQPAWQTEEPPAEFAEQFQQLLTDAIDAADEDYNSPYHPMELLSVVDPRVPADALAKVRRRYLLPASFAREDDGKKGGGGD